MDELFHTSPRYTAHEAIGISVNQLLFTRNIKRQRLGEALGVQGQAVSKKLRGQSRWTIEEIYAMAEFFELDLMDLLPRKLPRGYEIGAPFNKGPQSNLVAGAGFEPATSGLVTDASLILEKIL